MSKTKYIPTTADEIPADVRWEVPARNQGQMVEVAYASPGSRYCADHGDKYQRVLDRSVGPAAFRYYVRLDD